MIAWGRHDDSVAMIRVGSALRGSICFALTLNSSLHSLSWAWLTLKASTAFLLGNHFTFPILKYLTELCKNMHTHAHTRVHPIP